MAKIWAVYEGREAPTGAPWARLPLQKAVDLFDVRPENHVADLASSARLGDVNHNLSYAGLTHIVVEIEPGEARRAKWKPGFYKSNTSPKDAFSKLVQESLVEELGEDNVIRVEHEPTTDSRGRDALKIRVVIAPDAIHRLANGAVLDALVRLRARLREMREERIPIIEYATEAELHQNGGP